MGLATVSVGSDLELNMCLASLYRLIIGRELDLRLSLHLF
jgi:hypothetical protein